MLFLPNNETLMKKLFLSFTLILVCFNAISQEEEKFPKHEIKLNAAYLLAGIPEIGYAQLLSEESSIGIDLLFNIVGDVELKFALTPYYRFYFGNDIAKGFFVEGFGMLNTIETETYNGFDVYDYTDETDFALGFSLGGKFVTNNNFTFEIYGGVGRNLFNTKSDDFVPRLGVTIGKRF